MENSNNAGKMIGALLIGAAIGGALGILFAPDKGSETRKKLCAKGEDLTDGMKEKFNDFLEEIKKEVEATKEKIS
jgi:gas vesicle protein